MFYALEKSNKLSVAAASVEEIVFDLKKNLAKFQKPSRQSFLEVNEAPESLPGYTAVIKERIQHRLSLLN